MSEENIKENVLVEDTSEEPKHLLDSLTYVQIDNRFVVISPKTGKPVLPYQERVINEAIGLRQTITDFMMFPNTIEYEQITEEERVLINNQIDKMNEYLTVLLERIALY